MSQILAKVRKQEVMQKGVRLVLFPLPLQGHVTPMFHLATLLHVKGFAITIIQTKYRSLDPTLFPHFTFHLLDDDGLPDTATFGASNHTAILATLNTNCSEPFRSCITQILSKDPIACLITDPMWSFTNFVATSLSIPRIVLRCASMSSFYVCHSLSFLREKGYYPLQETKFDEPIPELPPLKVKDLPPEANHNLLVDIITEMENSQGIICNTFDELEDFYITRVQQVLTIPIFTLGPIHKNSPSFHQASIWTQDHTAISWLDTQAPKSVLYVSFGSMVQVTKAEFVEIACGLANSKQPFIWAVRRGSVEGSNETDPLPLPDGYSDTLCQRGNIVNWAPQQQVLAHPAVGGFWTHCGWNSIMESISEGVPMLCLPFFADQNINTRHVIDNWRVGMELDKGIERGEIAKAVRKLMVEEDGQAMRNRVTALKQKATLSVIEGGSSYKSLENLTNYLMSF